MFSRCEADGRTVRSEDRRQAAGNEREGEDQANDTRESSNHATMLVAARGRVELTDVRAAIPGAANKKKTRPENRTRLLQIRSQIKTVFS